MSVKTIDVESFEDLIERFEYTNKIAAAMCDLASRNLKRIEGKLTQ